MPTTLDDRPQYRWAVVGMLWCVCFFNYADRQAIFSVFPLLASEFRLSDIQLGVVAASFMWVYAGFGPIAGWISDRVSRKTVILGALAFWSLATAATALSTGYSSLVWLRALGGLGEAFYFPAAMSMLGDYHGQTTRSRAMSIHQSSVYAGSIAGGTLSALVAEHHGWRSSFLFFGAAGLLLNIMLLLSLREPTRGATEEKLATHEKQSILTGIRDVLTNPNALALIAIFIGANFVAVVFLTWMPTFLFRKFHMTVAMAGFSATAYIQAASVCGVLLGGMLADRAARQSRSGRIQTQALGLLLGVPFLFFAGWTTSTKVLLVAFLGFGLSKGLYDANIWASLYDVTPTNRRGVAAGVMNSLGWLGGGTAPVLIAAAATHVSLSVCVSATALIYLVLGLAALALRRRVDHI
ncbi:MFS transporter [Granulicella sp. WH15]|uniref:MFS transporter n=1 Tax=Granulicella sp. WH15 TaxID=2602070 RepID=UPI001366A3E9|nr:MFS transporter [Granulicella sp. WH15]QHN04335.1 MFS transporter [Granulicella sp. WH15]